MLTPKIDSGTLQNGAESDGNDTRDSDSVESNDSSNGSEETGAGDSNADEKAKQGGRRFVEEADPDANRQPMARLYEDEEKVGGAHRWTLSTHRNSCAGCEKPLPIGEAFHTVLLPAKDVDPKGLHPDCSEVFARQDFCARCFPTVKLEEAFAHWAAVLPPPDKPPTKIVNLASLLAYFERLLGIDEKPERRDDHDDEPTETPQDEPDVQTEFTSHAQDREEQLLEYLIGLFLVRKRILKWGELDGAYLTLIRKGKDDAPDRHYRVPAPNIADAELEYAVKSFEELFS